MPVPGQIFVPWAVPTGRMASGNLYSRGGRFLYGLCQRMDLAGDVKSLDDGGPADPVRALCFRHLLHPISTPPFHRI